MKALLLLQTLLLLKYIFRNANIYILYLTNQCYVTS
jgi:hypothetical protein